MAGRPQRMKRRQAFVCVWAAVAAVVLLGVPLSAEADPPIAKIEACPECNIVFVSFDTLRADYDALVSREGTLLPVFDALAKQGVVFSRAVSASSWTLPATLSWFTGVSPSRHGVINKYAPDSAMEEGDPVLSLATESPELVTLAEALRQHGYRTAAFTGGAGVSRQFGFDRGFERYEDALDFGGFRDAAPAALEWIAAHRSERLFVFLHGYDCHGQHDPPGGLDYRYVPEGYEGSFTGTAQEQKQLRQDGLAQGQLFLTEEDVRFWKGVYAEKVERSGEAFAEFLDGYQALGLMDRTIFVVTSDHGEELMEHGRLDHGPTLYEEVVRVPLIIAAPARAAAGRSDVQARGVDLMPTLLVLAAVPVAENVRAQMEGRDLFSDTRPADAVIETDYRYYAFLRALRTADQPFWKLIVDLETNQRELYQLSEDAKELSDQYASYRLLANRMAQRLLEH